MTAKQIFNLILVICICVFIGSYISLLDKTSKQNDNIEQLRHNLTVKDTKISNMTFKVDELEDYLKAKDTKHKVTVDSLLKKLSVKPKNLISYQEIQVQNTDTDTTTVSLQPPTIVNDSLYSLKFESVRKCLIIEGIIYSKDPTSSAVITKTSGENRIFIVKSYKKSFWDVVFFRKGKEIIQTTSDCGDINFNSIDVDRK